MVNKDEYIIIRGIGEFRSAFLLRLPVTLHLHCTHRFLGTFHCFVAAAVSRGRGGRGTGAHAPGRHGTYNYRRLASSQLPAKTVTARLDNRFIRARAALVTRPPSHGRLCWRSTGA